MFSVRDLRDNYYNAYLANVSCLSGKYGEGEDYKWVDCSPGFWTTHIYDLSTDLLNCDKKSAEMYLRAQKDEIPRYITHFSDCSDGIFPSLTKAGFAHRTTMPGMQCKLSDFDFDGMEQNHFEINHLSSAEEAAVFTDIIQRGLVTNRRCYAPHFQKLADHDGFQLLLGRYKGEPAATGLVFVSNGVAGLSLIVVDDQFRGLKLGKAMTLRMMHEGLQAGCTDAVLYASKAGEPVYKKLGYQNAGYVHIYC